MFKNKDGELVFSPSDLMRFMESEYVTWLDRYHIEFPGSLTPDQPAESEEILQQKGQDHESNFLAEQISNGRDVCDLSAVDREYRHKLTLEAMQAGREIIYQAELKDGRFTGYSDFLFKVADKSELGNYSYEPWDTKLALSPKPYFLVQLSCYADLLTEVQGRPPRRMHLLLGDRSSESFRTENYLYFYWQLRRAFLEQQLNFDPDAKFEFTGREKFGRWTGEVEKLIKETDHLCQVANIRTLQIKRLKHDGVNSMTELATTKLVEIAGMHPTTLSALKQQARLQLGSLEQPVPKFELLEPIQGFGLHLVPPSSKNDVYFDMEGYPLEEEGLEYLFGVTVVDQGRPEFLDWWAHNQTEEKSAFESFIDWLYDRWQQDRSLHVFHYAAYEKNALKKLMSRYATREFEVDELLRNEVFVDLYQVVKQSIKVGTPNYSIKSIEKLYRPKRDTDCANAMDSIVYYQRWLNQKDGDTWQTSSILKQIRDYNQDDCDSTWQLAEWLRALQRDSHIVPLERPYKEPPDGEQAQTQSQAAALAKELLQHIPVDPSLKTDQLRVRELIAHLLEFHKRETRPVFWALYNRSEMTERELFDDPCCLAGLKLVNASVQKKRSRLYEYKFNPNQDTKIDIGNRCFFAHDLRNGVVVEDIDCDAGIIVLRRSVSGEPLPERLSLIKDEYINPAELAKSIFRTAQTYVTTGALPPAIDDFLSRRAPRIHGQSVGEPLLQPAESLTNATSQLLKRLNNTTLCIQGPPGSGKTYTAAKSILALLQSGKRVAVTSNSHKAIANLLQRVAEEAEAENFDLRAVKLQSEQADFHCQSRSVKKSTPVKFFNGQISDWHLVGGTAWAFSSQAAVGLFDYLFVDEAGQVSVANLFSMAPSTKNIVLIGDQMQLSQPLKGVHPGESGQSVLEYLLQGESVIDKRFGVFLDRTRRMHPEICRFISGAVYEDRLRPHPDNHRRSLHPGSGSTIIEQHFGMLYLPVEHEGNAQDSQEEAATIVQIVEELKRSTLREVVDPRTGVYVERVFNIEKDLLIVAPYNMQVRRLKHLLPGLSVGSVDKFQGQEAPIVIVSMCSSTGDISPRGLEFIFSKNRLNVAISRAQIMAIVVGSPTLARTKCRRVEQLELVNLFCRIVESGTQQRSEELSVI